MTTLTSFSWDGPSLDSWLSLPERTPEPISDSLLRPSNTFTMKEVQFQSTAVTASSPGQIMLNHSKAQGLSKLDWLELKPIIRELYQEQKQTLKQLAAYIQEHHGVKPT
jgi:hypothetical protein